MGFIPIIEWDVLRMGINVHEQPAEVASQLVDILLEAGYSPGEICDVSRIMYLVADDKKESK